MNKRKYVITKEDLFKSISNIKNEQDQYTYITGYLN